ncbi:hypothetical protein AA313_de0208325 [Arthrobotrys entomopaga]|nr:hypothetical protein AA313_de0208325 [Arthrobotrys entomopaga]
MQAAIRAALLSQSRRPIAVVSPYTRRIQNVTKVFLSTAAASDDTGPGNLLITVDAFGTFYSPKKPVHEQYFDIANDKFPLKRDAEMGKRLKDAIASQLKKHSIYGRATGMSPKEWWKEVVIKTMEPYYPTTVPETLPDLLWSHFSTAKAYELSTGSTPFLKNIRDLKQLALKTRRGELNWVYKSVTVGVITNSDDRVVDVLKDLGVGVGYRTVSSPPDVYNAGKNDLTAGISPEGGISIVPEEGFDDSGTAAREGGVFDFVATSYAVGAEKPDKAIFDAALASARGILKEVYNDDTGRFFWIHIGDEANKDVVGPMRAGGIAVLHDTKRKEGELERMISLDGVGIDCACAVVTDLREALAMLEVMEFMDCYMGLGWIRTPLPAAASLKEPV